MKTHIIIPATLASILTCSAIDLNEKRKVSEKGKTAKEIAQENKSKNQVYIARGTITNLTPFKGGFKGLFTDNEHHKTLILIGPKNKHLANKIGTYQFKTTQHGTLLLGIAPKKR